MEKASQQRLAERAARDAEREAEREAKRELEAGLNPDVKAVTRGTANEFAVNADDILVSFDSASGDGGVQTLNAGKVLAILRPGTRYSSVGRRATEEFAMTVMVDGLCFTGRGLTKNWAKAYAAEDAIKAIFNIDCHRTDGNKYCQRFRRLLDYSWHLSFLSICIYLHLANELQRQS